MQSLLKKFERHVLEGELEQAQAIVEQLRSQIPREKLAFFKYLESCLFIKLGDHPAALACIEVCKQFKPDNIGNESAEANIYMSMSAWSDAASACRRVIDRSIEQNDVFYLNDAWGNLAYCLARLGEKKEAEECLARITRPEPFLIFCGRRTSKQILSGD